MTNQETLKEIIAWCEARIKETGITTGYYANIISQMRDELKKCE